MLVNETEGILLACVMTVEDPAVQLRDGEDSD